jgi:hypothetical protein
MNEKIKNAWEFVKEHKKEFAIAAVTVIGGVILIKSVSKPECTKNIGHFTIHKPEKNLPDLGVGVVGDVIQYDDAVTEIWMDHIPLSDMGKLGEAIRENFPDIPDDYETWALLNIHEPNKVFGLQEF